MFALQPTTKTKDTTGTTHICQIPANLGGNEHLPELGCNKDVQEIPKKKIPKWIRIQYNYTSES